MIVVVLNDVELVVITEIDDLLDAVVVLILVG